jgi:hypothetical protein
MLSMVLLTLALAAELCRSRATSAESFCSGGREAGPAVLLCDDFEDGDVRDRWTIDSNRNSLPATQFVACANEAFGFNDRCAAWSNLLLFDGSWGFYGYDARRSFAPQSELYVRWYQYISDPYTWGSLEDKSVMLHDRANTITAYVATSRNQQPSVRTSGAGMPFVANYQDLDWPDTGGTATKVNRFQTEGKAITLEPGKWYLFEWYVKLNTPGQSNGITSLWVDDASRPIATQTLRLHDTDMRWLKNANAGTELDTLRLTVYDQRCDAAPSTCPPNGPSVLKQSHRWDRIVVSRQRIGPAEERRSVP